MEKSEGEEEEEETGTEKQEVAVQAPPPAPKIDRVAALSKQTFVYKEQSFAGEIFRELGDLGTKMRIHGYRYRYNFKAFREMITEYTNLMYLLGGHCENIEATLGELDAFVEDLIWVPRRLQIPHVLAYISYLLWKADLGLKKPREKKEFDLDVEEIAEKFTARLEETRKQHGLLQEVQTR